MAFDQNKYIGAFRKQNYDRIELLLPKGKREILKDTASKKGRSMNQLIIESVEDQHNIDLTTKENE